MAPVFLSISTLMSARPVCTAKVSALRRSSRLDVWSLIAVMMASALAMIVALRSLPVSSICRRRTSPFLFMAVTILSPLSSIVVLIAVKPFKRVSSILSKLVLILPKLPWVLSSRSLMAPVFLLISTLMSFRPVSIAVVRALKRSFIVEVWSLIALMIASALAIKVALRSLPVVSICRRKISPFSFKAVTILSPLSSIVVLMAVKPLKIVVLMVLRPAFRLSPCAVMAPVLLLISTLMSVNPPFTAAVKAAMRSAMVLPWLLITSTSALPEANIWAEISLPVVSICRRRISPFWFMAYTMASPWAVICPVSVVICRLNASKPLNRDVLMSFRPFLVFSLNMVMAPVLASTATLMSAMPSLNNVLRASKRSFRVLFKLLTASTSAE